MSVTTVDGKQFNQVIKNSDRPVVVYYWASWCGPCKQQAPIMDKLARDFEGRVSFIKINTEEDLDTANFNNVKGLPAIHIYNKKGEMVKAFQGTKTARMLTDILSEQLSN